MSLSSSRLCRQRQFGDFVMDGTASSLLSHLSRDVTDVVLSPKKEALPMASNFGVDCRNGALLEEAAPTLQARCARSVNGGGVS